MFVYSFKASKRQIISMILCVVMLIAVLVVAILFPLGSSKASAETYKPVTGSNDDERIAFLTGLGYEVNSKSPIVKEVLIPDEFDEVFNRYNQVQQEANMDLKPYHGKRVKCWSYKILNVPEQGEVIANLYVFKDKIIGGDISSTALDGFMHGLVKFSGEAVKTTARTSGAAAITSTAASTTATKSNSKK